MRARLWFVIACTAAPTGCGLLSGLDQLTVGDAATLPLDGAADARTDGSDAPQAIDGNPIADAHPDADAATPPVVPDVNCGGNLVCTQGNVCCLVNQLFSCASSCPIGALVLKCDDQADCMAGSCCANVNDAGGITGATCEPVCAGVILCNAPTTICKCTGQKTFGGQIENYCQ